MIKKRKTPRRAPPAVAELRGRLQAAEETLRALRAGEVDALVVSRADGEQVVALQGADLPYRALLDQMYAGAVTLTPTGVVVYCNQRFADIVRTPLARVIGSALRRFAAPAEQPIVVALLERASADRVKGQLEFRAGNGASIPVSVTFAPLRFAGSTDASGVIGVVVDDTERRHQEELRARLVRHAMTAQDEERRRIARELHDETGQSLTALLVGLRTIEDARTVAEATEWARRLRATVAETLQEVGRMARGLHPSIIDDVGLGAALIGHARDFAQLHGTAVDVRIAEPDAADLPPMLQTTLYRFLQEALTNVARHAGARNVRVALARNDATVELCVADDGGGFDTTARPAATAGDRRRLGLQGMRERAALLGGSIAVESRAGAGTTITARFPLNGA